ncbi:alpha/beta hydrolase [Pseudomonas sp. NPDC089752]|uniref:alpha/beta hydrolase n=1 Tax=Pseudomonas sp. NPDC089752 TaxID=3364472 RepID=UPI0037FF4E78
MALHPELDAFLDLADDAAAGGTLPFHQSTAQQARDVFEQTTRQLAWALPEDVAWRDLQALTRDGQALPLRLYLPRGRALGELPVMVYFHGGGYVVGSIDSHDGVCREFCSKTPCAVLSVGYRRAPEHKFPTALHDCADALAWLHEHGQAEGLDCARVIFAGDSVGASLAATLATQAVHQPSEVAIRPVLQMLCYPMTDASRRSVSVELFAEGYLLESETLEWFYTQYANTAEDRQDWRFSPLLTPDLRGVAPALVVLAGFDPLLDEGREYAARLQAAGVEVALIEYAGLTHDLLRLRSVVSEVAAIHQALAARVGVMLESAAG